MAAAGCANDSDDGSAPPSTSSTSTQAQGSGGAGDPSSGGGTPSGDPIVIGGSLGLTGMYSGPSAGYKAAYEYAVEEINDSGGLLGRPVELKIYDDESNATTAQQLYQKLINDDKVDLLLAPYTTAVGGAVVPITERAGKVLFDAGFVSKQLHAKSKLMVSSWAYQEPEYPKPFFEFLKSLPDGERPTKLAVATEQNPFTLVARDGYEGEGGVLNYAKELGIEVVSNEEYDGTATDLTGVVQHAKASGADVFVALGLPNGSSLMAKTVHQEGFKPKYYCQCGSQVTTLPNWPDLGDAAVGVFSTTTAWPTQSNAGLADLYQHMKTALGTDVLPAYAAGGYAIMQVIQQAVNGAQTLDQQKLREYIGQNSFDTAVGKLTYNADGTVKFGALLVQYQKGGNEVIWPDSEATGKAVPLGG
ncbi:MAG TPA: amino acid ABC transporter substrate-binding protein [Nakamurella sp.]|jgi:branched-chain amino acid transport system substrate-binding protein|nr:amino acid ABC transporter substrate-binding protein [Nakamurella sp.]